jgi:hypothetical protein
VSLTFVVGTGRCGSTMLSRVLHLHPDVLSVSELFHLLMDGNEIVSRPMDGRELWRRLTEVSPNLDGLIQAGLKTPEVAYPYEFGRFNPVDGVPGICHHVLSLISDDPDTLFDRLAAEVPAWPQRPAADQYRALFATLAGMLGRRVIVERSGGSLIQVAQLRQLFPEARFVLIYRDGPDCALSMSRHSAMRLVGMTYAAALAAPPPPEPASVGDAIAAAPEEFDGLLAPPFDAERFMSYPIPLSIFGWMWSVATRDGVNAFRQIAPDVRMGMKYEQLIADPRPRLARLAQFIGAAAAPQWLDKAAALIDPGRSGRAASDLDPQVLADLRVSCAPGTRVLASLESELG